MYPDQNQNQPQYSIDYLNQIAPQPVKPGMNNKKFLLLVGGGLLLVIIVGVMILSSGGSGPTQKIQTLAARMQTLQTISDKAQKNIQSGKLRSTNSNLTIFLTNANRDVVDPLKKAGVDVKKLDKSIVTLENGNALNAKLEDARLNATFDRTYAREMGYQLDTIAVLMKDIYNSSNSKSMKDFLLATDKNLDPVKKELNGFNAANG